MQNNPHQPQCLHTLHVGRFTMRAEAFSVQDYILVFLICQSLSVLEVLKSCLTLCDPMDCSLPVSSVRGILQGCHFLFQGIFPIQGPNPCPLHQQVNSLPPEDYLLKTKKSWTHETDVRGGHRTLKLLGTESTPVILVKCPGLGTSTCDKYALHIGSHASLTYILLYNIWRPGGLPFSES